MKQTTLEQRIIEELESLLYQQTKTKVIHSSIIKDRIKQLKSKTL